MTSWHTLTSDEALSALGSGPSGLNSEKARRLLADLGQNLLEGPKKPPLWRTFLGKFKEYLVIVLLLQLSSRSSLAKAPMLMLSWE